MTEAREALENICETAKDANYWVEQAHGKYRQTVLKDLDRLDELEILNYAHKQNAESSARNTAQLKGYLNDARERIAKLNAVIELNHKTFERKKSDLSKSHEREKKLIENITFQDRCPTKHLSFSSTCPQDLSVGDKDTRTCGACWQAWLKE